MKKTFLSLVLLISTAAAGASTPKLLHRDKNVTPTAAYRWLQILLEASGRDVDRNKARPTILSRTMAIVLTSMYDAWSAYDDKAVSTTLGGQLRRPVGERTLQNKETAIAYAAYRSLIDVYPEDVSWLAQQMKDLGYDPKNETQDVTKPEGIGNIAAREVIEFRHHDGANQLGSEVGGVQKPYSDYTFYRPKNSPENIVDPTSWLPITFSDGKGGTVTPGFLTPHWYRVKPFALKSADQFRAPPPPLYGSKLLKKEVEEAIKVNADLTTEQKAVVEFMRDGPRSTGQSGHWLQFAQDVSRRDRFDLDQDIKLFFAVGNVVFDAFIACWDTKRFYDTSRPYWWARIYYKNQKIKGWQGPGKGTAEISAENWHPYSPDTFITPPFPGYVSGHATASAAAAKILELLTGSDKFGATEIRMAGALTGEELNKEVRLELPTFTATAEMAAVSRLWGGYHIRTDNEEGLKLGRKIAKYSWPIYKSYFDGTIEKNLKIRSYAVAP